MPSSVKYHRIPNGNVLEQQQNNPPVATTGGSTVRRLRCRCACCSRHTLIMLMVCGAVSSLLYVTFTFLTCTNGPLSPCARQPTFRQLVSGSRAALSQLFLPETSPRRARRFNVSGDTDVVVFLHMQKTGGTTLGRHLVRDLVTRDNVSGCVCDTGLNVTSQLVGLGMRDTTSHERRQRRQRRQRTGGKKRKKKRGGRKKRKRCSCLRPHSSHSVWLFSRYSVGWRCGLHADWTELTACVDDWYNDREGTVKGDVDRKYFYITILREPVARYISEFRHVQRGATWRTARLMCGGRPASRQELPSCYPMGPAGDGTWANVTLRDFLACPHNLAHNRQTRMLADLTLVNCYNTTGLSADQLRHRDDVMLRSAINNLHAMVFFGLTEYQQPSQYMFEHTFNMKFRMQFEQYTSTRSEDTSISKSEHAQIMERNALDIRLYKYAKDLFLQRFQHFRNTYPADLADTSNEDTSEQLQQLES